MKKLKKIKLNIEKDIISSISKEDQIEIKGGYQGDGFGSQDTCGRPDWYTRDDLCTRQCSMAYVTCICAGGGNTGGGNAGGGNAGNNGGNYTDRCAPTGSEMSQQMDYNCFTFHTMCNC